MKDSINDDIFTFKEDWIHIDSLHLSKILSQRHDRLLERIRKVCINLMIDIDNNRECVQYDYYINSQNKKQPKYNLSKWFTLELLKTFSRKNHPQACVYLNKINIKDVAKPKTVAENKFHNILSGVLNNFTIIRQYRVRKYYVDFYIPELKLFIEFDEGYHNSQIHIDQERQTEILENCSLEIEFLRVKESEMYKGLKQILHKAVNVRTDVFAV